MAHGLRYRGESIVYPLRRRQRALAANEVSKMTGLRESHAPYRVGDRIGVTARRMERSCTARLSGERPVCSLPQRLSRSQGELVSDRRRRDGVALENLPADGVVLSIEANAGSTLDDNRDRKRGDSSCVA